jgi:predicted  nucleic acid-binding Zn-ribbon protein
MLHGCNEKDSNDWQTELLEASTGLLAEIDNEISAAKFEINQINGDLRKDIDNTISELNKEKHKLKRLLLKTKISTKREIRSLKKELKTTEKEIRKLSREMRAKLGKVKKQ